MVRKTGLGKGMGALLPVVEKEQTSYFICPIEDIKPNRAQPRKTFTSEKLEELAASIREKGVIQPLVVIKKAGHFEIIAGERRWRAAQKAGLHEVPVVIQDVSDHASLSRTRYGCIRRILTTKKAPAESRRGFCFVRVSVPYRKGAVTSP